MKATNPWITYRTRFLVRARQLTTSLAFSDVLGRQHSGRKGDYLVESSDGVLRIAPRQIFEDIYVPLLGGEALVGGTFAAETPQPDQAQPQLKSPLQYETLVPEAASQQRATLPQLRTVSRRETPLTLPLPPLLTRKSPQPYRDRRSPTPGLRSL